MPSPTTKTASPLLAVVAPNLAVKPPTVMFNKVTIKGAKQAVQMFGPAQRAVAMAVADCVEDGTIPAAEADNIFICVGVFIHWDAADDTKIQDYNYAATGIHQAPVAGDPKASEVVAKKSTMGHPFAAQVSARLVSAEPVETYVSGSCQSSVSNWRNSAGPRRPSWSALASRAPAPPARRYLFQVGEDLRPAAYTARRVPVPSVLQSARGRVRCRCLPAQGSSPAPGAATRLRTDNSSTGPWKLSPLKSIDRTGKSSGSAAALMMNFASTSDSLPRQVCQLRIDPPLQRPLVTDPGIHP
jgi:5,6,7,8-tetrahydromethanopterin hydro-lyase